MDEQCPEVFTFSFLWRKDPSPIELMKVLVSIAESLQTTSVFNDAESKKVFYWFRGLTCQVNDHHLAYFRRTMMKKSHITTFLRVPEKLKASVETKLAEDITDKTEWVKYDDDSVQFVPENWTGVLKECLKNHAIPTLLFFEKTEISQPGQKSNVFYKY